MDIIVKATELLQENGPWALVVIMGVVIWRMATYITKMHDQRREDDKNLITVMERFRASVDALTKAVDRM